MATITETWVKAGGWRPHLLQLMLITRRYCASSGKYADITMLVQECQCNLHVYMRSEPGLYRFAYLSRNRDAYVSAEWDLWSKEDEHVST